MWGAGLRNHTLSRHMESAVDRERPEISTHTHVHEPRFLVELLPKANTPIDLWWTHLPKTLHEPRNEIFCLEAELRHAAVMDE